MFDDPQPASGQRIDLGGRRRGGLPDARPAAPSYNDFSTGAYQTGNLPTPPPGSYEVSAGWATIDDSDSVAGSYGYDQQGYPNPAPPQNAGGSWPPTTSSIPSRPPAAVAGGAAPTAAIRRPTNPTITADFPVRVRPPG